MTDLGHNNPPSKLELFEQDLANLTERVAEMALLDVTEENSGGFNDLIGQGKNLSKDIEATRKAEKDPHFQAGKAVDAAFNPVKELALKAVAPLQAMLQAWLIERKRVAELVRREAEAKAASEATAAKALEDDALMGERSAKAAEDAAAEARLAAAEEIARATVKGSAGFRAGGLRTTYSVKVVNAALLVEAFGDHPDVIAAAEKSASAALRASDDKKNISIPGVEIIETEKLV